MSLFVLQNVHGELFIGQIETQYNIGDDFNISVTIKPPIYVSDFFIADLVCGDNEVNLYRAPYTLNSGAEKQVIISTKLGTLDY